MNPWNALVRRVLRLFGQSEVAQGLQGGERGGTLAVPEIAPLARQIAAEGMVLLKNQRETLPIRPGETVAVFGRCAVDYFTVGYGSGGDVRAPYKTNLMDGLQACGVSVDRPLADRYAQWCRSHRPDEGYWGHWPTHLPEPALSQEEVAGAARRCNLALVVLGRAAGEDRENSLRPGSYYRTAQERRLLRQVTAAFDRVAVILDCGSLMDLAWTEDLRLGAVLLAWQGGMESGRALADVLTGRVNPCGRLPDTVARHYGDYPSSRHFGHRRANTYVEDIFVGYRYFETFAPERVLYPFGFGLSYTTFSWEIAGAAADRTVTLTCTVTNTGTVPGREVVQVYVAQPQGVLGKPCRVLACFGKTALLRPGQRETVPLSFDLDELASFDDTGATGHAHSWVLEPGTYTVLAGRHVRDARPVVTVEVPALEVLAARRETCAVRPGHGFHRMVSRDGQLRYAPVPMARADLRRAILDALPPTYPHPGRAVSFGDVQAGRATVEEFVGQLTPETLDQLTHGQGTMNADCGAPGNAGAFGGVTAALRALGLPAAVCTDGPAGIRLWRTAALLPCGTAQASTFDPAAVERLYRLVGREMRALGSDLLLAPGMNLHRDPLCGRNFEYFAEDPLLTGRMAAAVVRGIQSQGRGACPKHFACNNQETNRCYHDSRLSERALRELYCRGFELVVREAKPWAIMTSYNKVNGIWSHYHYPLATQILREEWGYDGLVITDWWMRRAASPEFPHLRDDAYRIRAQVDVLMPGAHPTRTVPEALRHPQGLTLGEAQRSAAHVVRFLLRLRNGISQDDETNPAENRSYQTEETMRQPSAADQAEPARERCPQDPLGGC